MFNSGGKIKRTRAAAAATRSLATAAAFGDIILYGGAGNFPNVEHLFVRSFMTRAARGGYWRGPVDRRRLVAVVVRVAVVALPLSGRARTHSHTHTRAHTTTPLRHYLYGRAREPARTRAATAATVVAGSSNRSGGVRGSAASPPSPRSESCPLPGDGQSTGAQVSRKPRPTAHSRGIRRIGFLHIILLLIAFIRVLDDN